jgi:hypothetical protein
MLIKPDFDGSRLSLRIWGLALGAHGRTAVLVGAGLMSVLVGIAYLLLVVRETAFVVECRAGPTRPANREPTREWPGSSQANPGIRQAGSGSGFFALVDLRFSCSAIAATRPSRGHLLGAIHPRRAGLTVPLRS